MTLTEAASLFKKMEASPRGRVDMVKRTIPDDDASFVVLFRLHSGSHAQVTTPAEWPLPKTLV